MALTPRLELRQSQSLVMTPQLQQAIKLLQFSNQELMAYVEDELERNPLLEKQAGDDVQLPESNETELAELNTSISEPDTMDAADLSNADVLPSEANSPLDTDYDNHYNSDGSADLATDPTLSATLSNAGSSGGSGTFEDRDFNLDQNESAAPTLREHLIGQLQVSTTDSVVRMIGMELIDTVDEAGYLTAIIEELAGRLGCTEQQISEVIELLQGFDPTGICARNLSECLALQLIEQDRYDPAMEAMVNNLDLVAKRDLKGLKKVCQVDDEDIVDMIQELRSLNPKPGLAFDHELPSAVTPDVFVRKGPDGLWLVDLNSETLPRVLVNNRYHAQVAHGIKDKKDKTYVSECLNTANWLVKSLAQRANTILKVSTEIVRQQSGFLEHGVTHLRPLTLKDIAAEIEMHESTVSRVTTNKFITTPRGIFELKYFFTSAINATGGGDSHSAESVKHHIKTLIDAEDPKKILSDDKLVSLLKNEGIDVARRTVAKYREAMGIPSSVQRRREKKSLI